MEFKLISDESDLKIKEDLYRIANGNYKGDLSCEQIEFALKLSFLFNFTKIKSDVVRFEYNEYIAEIKGMTYDLPDSKEFIISMISKTDMFKDALKSFLRDTKIKKIIE